MNPDIFRVSCVKNINIVRNKQCVALSLTFEAREDSAYNKFQILLQVRSICIEQHGDESYIHRTLDRHPQFHGT